MWEPLETGISFAAGCCSFVSEALLHIVEKVSLAFIILHYMLNCKINSTNGGTFSKSAEKIILIFFFFRGPQLCPNRPGNTKF